MLKMIVMIVVMISSAAYAQINTPEIVSLGTVEKDPEGKPILLNYRSAVDYCKEKQKRLPSPLEFALARMGKNHIRFSQYMDLPVQDPRVNEEIGKMAGEWYWENYRTNNNGIAVVDFYSRPVRYDQTFVPIDPKSDEAGYFWTSQLVPQEISKIAAYFYDGHTPEVHRMARVYEELKVRCIL